MSFLEIEEERKLMQRLLCEIRHDPDLPKKVRELMPILRFADERYAAVHPDLIFWPLESLAERILQNYSPPGESKFF